MEVRTDDIWNAFLEAYSELKKQNSKLIELINDTLHEYHTPDTEETIKKFLERLEAITDGKDISNI